MNLEDLKLDLAANHQNRIDILYKASRCKRGSEKFLALKAESERLQAEGDRLMAQIKSLNN